MSTSNNKTTDGCLGLFLGSLLCFGIIAQIDSMPWNVQSKHIPYEPPKTESHYTSNIDSGQRARKIIKSIRPNYRDLRSISMDNFWRLEP